MSLYFRVVPDCAVKSMQQDYYHKERYVTRCIQECTSHTYSSAPCDEQNPTTTQNENKSGGESTTTPSGGGSSGSGVFPELKVSSLRSNSNSRKNVLPVAYVPIAQLKPPEGKQRVHPIDIVQRKVRRMLEETIADDVDVQAEHLVTKYQG
eukprot:PhF_6_TR43680/c1_g1_i4/m.67129